MCTHWELMNGRPRLKGLSDCRSRFWRGGGEEKKKLLGQGSGITSTIAKWKPVLEWGWGGNKGLSVWAAPFGSGEILSAATPPPTPSCVLGWLRQQGRVGRAPRRCHVPLLHWQLFAGLASSNLHDEDEQEQKSQNKTDHEWTMNLWQPITPQRVSESHSATFLESE